MNELSAVIVTYLKDIEKLHKCVSSILQYGAIFKEIIIVVNDEAHTMSEFDCFKQDPRIVILHYTEVTEWPGTLDWWSQQYFKIAISNKIKTPWYLILDSDDFIIEELLEEKLFCENKAYHGMEDRWQIDNSQHGDFLSYLKNAYKHWNNDSLPAQTMGCLTPFNFNTKVAKDIASLVTPDMFNTRFTFEFYLYFSYLDSNKMFYDLYEEKWDTRHLYNKTT